MKKAFALALCAALALSVTACSSDEPEESSSEPSTSQSTSVEQNSTSVTPEQDGSYVDYQTLEEAQSAVGFTWNVPYSIGDSTDREFRVADGSVLDILYKKDETRTACLRKAAGTEDLSADSAQYEQVEEAAVGNSTVSMRGSNDLYSLAIWTDDTYTYSVSLDTGISQDELSQLVQSLQETI